jgi:putative salt-induced outer membrane protein
MAAKLLGPLSAQVSYTVQYESMPPEGRVSTDTISRASLVYTF